MGLTERTLAELRNDEGSPYGACEANRAVLEELHAAGIFDIFTDCQTPAFDRTGSTVYGVVKCCRPKINSAFGREEITRQIAVFSRGNFCYWVRLLIPLTTVQSQSIRVLFDKTITPVRGADGEHDWWFVRSREGLAAFRLLLQKGFGDIWPPDKTDGDTARRLRVEQGSNQGRYKEVPNET